MVTNLEDKTFEESYAHIWSGHRYGGKLHIYMSKETEGEFAFSICDIPGEDTLEGIIKVEAAALEILHAAPTTEDKAKIAVEIQIQAMKCIDAIYMGKNIAIYENVKKSTPNFKVH